MFDPNLERLARAAAGSGAGSRCNMVVMTHPWPRAWCRGCSRRSRYGGGQGSKGGGLRGVYVGRSRSQARPMGCTVYEKTA